MKTSLLVLIPLMTLTSHAETLEELIEQAGREGMRRSQAESQRTAAPIRQENARKEWESKQKVNREMNEQWYALMRKHAAENAIMNAGRRNWAPSKRLEPPPWDPHASPPSFDFGSGQSSKSYRNYSSKTTTAATGTSAVFRIFRSSDKAECVGTAIASNALVTARHCLGGGSIELSDGTTSRKEVIHQTLSKDNADLAIAVFKGSPFSNTVKIGKVSTGTQANYTVIRGGSPSSGTVTVHSVAAKFGTKPTHFKTSVDKQKPADSGSPLFNSAGSVVGVLNGCNSEPRCYYYGLLSDSGYDVVQAAADELGRGVLKFDSSASQ